MRYLGIDPGAYTAIAVMDDKTVTNILHVDLNKVKENKILHYYNYLTELFNEWKPEVVYCEEPFMPPKFPQAGKSMNKKLAIIEVICQMDGVPYKFVNPSVVKKTLTGNGGCEKEPLARKVMELVDNPGIVQDLITDECFDETDAIAIAIAGYRTGGL